MTQITIIPVVTQGTRLVVFTDEPDTENKLDELYAYLRNLPIDDSWDMPAIVGSLLKVVGNAMKGDTHIFEANVGGIDEQEHGKLVFVQNQFVANGQYFRWHNLDIEEMIENVEYA